MALGGAGFVRGVFIALRILHPPPVANGPLEVGTGALRRSRRVPAAQLPRGTSEWMVGSMDEGVLSEPSIDPASTGAAGTRREPRGARFTTVSVHHPLGSRDAG